MEEKKANHIKLQMILTILALGLFFLARSYLAVDVSKYSPLELIEEFILHLSNEERANLFINVVFMYLPAILLPGLMFIYNYRPLWPLYSLKFNRDTKLRILLSVIQLLIIFVFVILSGALLFYFFMLMVTIYTLIEYWGSTNKKQRKSY